MVTVESRSSVRAAINGRMIAIELGAQSRYLGLGAGYDVLCDKASLANRCVSKQRIYGFGCLNHSTRTTGRALNVITISLCMIVKNEERTLARCLESVADLMDEIIIMDTGSSDRTMDIAAMYTDQVYTYVWNEDFAAARNESFARATQEYILWLDADDVLLPRNGQSLRR